MNTTQHPNSPSNLRRGLRHMAALTVLAAGLSPLAGQAAPLDDMVAFDAVYIPALAASTSASQDARAVPKAVAAGQALDARWPQLRSTLTVTWGSQPARAWTATLAAVDRQITLARTAAAASNWKDAHEALEDVRIELMKARLGQGMDYFIDQLTAYHEPMEALTIAASTWKPAEIDAQRRAQLEQAVLHAAALWRGIERHTLDMAAYGLPPAGQAQLRQALADESAALDRLTQAQRLGSTEQVLKAAAGLKPAFARAFTAFGRSGGAAQ
ncbi:MAG: hypothetical protein RIQ60_3438 [Pseudomonadota bacterium]|jgi:hypothetical protein